MKDHCGGGGGYSFFSYICLSKGAIVQWPHCFTAKLLLYALAKVVETSKRKGGGGAACLVYSFIYIVIKFCQFLISAATGAAVAADSGTVNAADQVGLLGFHNAACVVRGSFLFI